MWLLTRMLSLILLILPQIQPKTLHSILLPSITPHPIPPMAPQTITPQVIPPAHQTHKMWTIGGPRNQPSLNLL